MRILLVEDDQRIAKPLAEDLKHQRYVVDIAKDGIEGWEYSQSTQYDIILLDLMLHQVLTRASLLNKLWEFDRVSAEDTVKINYINPKPKQKKIEIKSQLNQDLYVLGDC